MVEYRLDELGWYQFERLCQALLKSAHGAVLEAWGGPTSDIGRDAYSAGRLRYPDPKVVEDGPFVFQVKFVAAANAAGSHPKTPLLKAVRAESERISERLKKGVWDVPRYYTLLTNVDLTPDLREEVNTVIREALPDTHIITSGATDIAAALDDNPSTRASYPQVLGIRDLETLIRQAAAADVSVRSAVSLDEARELSRVFVATAAYHKTLGVLGQHGFAVLTGPPEMGKTAIARMLSLAKATEEWSVVDCRLPTDLFKTFDHSRSQIFVVDDAFGSTEYRPDLAAEWASDLPKVLRLCDPTHWMIWTSRPGPLREGLSRLHLQGAAEKFPSPAEVQIDTARLSLPEKAQMLYRHAKAAGVTAEMVELIRTNATRIVNDEHFTPFRIQRLVTEQLPAVDTSDETARKDALRVAIESGLERPTHQMRTSFAALSDEHRCVLYALLEQSDTPCPLDDLEQRFVEQLGRPTTTQLTVLSEQIDEHFIRLRSGGDSVLRIDWIHPSVRDAVIAHLAENDLERTRFLKSAGQAAVMLALSVGGGREGNLALPLVRTDNDWSLVQHRVGALVETGDFGARMALLQGLLAVVTDDALSIEHTRLRSVAAAALSPLTAQWRDPTSIVSVPMLTAYFDLSIATGEIVPSPNLFETWRVPTERAKQAADDPRNRMAEFDEWLDLVFLLRSMEPRFLRVVRSTETMGHILTDFLHNVEAEIDGLEELDPEEDDEYEMGDGEYAVLPIEPSPEEEDERLWLDALIPIAEALPDLLEEERQRLEAVIKTSMNHSESRERRQERWEDLQSYEPEDDWRGQVRESDSFDIQALFSDL